MSDCIFAPINSVYGSSVVVIRISGNANDVKNCLNTLGVIKFNKVFDDFDSVVFPLVKVCKIYNKQQLIDEALITLFKAPQSFTGECVCEIALHASTYIVSTVIGVLSEVKNCRFAKAGEFSYRAFVNGKIDLIKAESINDIVKSQNYLAHNLAIKSYSGGLSSQFLNWKDKFIEISSLLTCYIDFAEDEEINHPFEKKVLSILNDIKTDMLNFVNTSTKVNNIKDGVKCCIFGSPNVGKSSFLNKISQKDVAIVSHIAGTTRDVIEYSVNIASLPVIFYDTAGIRQTDDIIELEGIKRAKLSIQQSNMQILMIDASKTDDVLLFVNNITPNTIAIINKIDIADLPTTIKIKQILKEAKCNNVCEISLTTEKGWGEFLAFFEDFVKTNFASGLQNSFSLNQRQEGSIKLCVQTIDEIADINHIELFSEDIRRCITILEQVVGVVDSESILDKMFATFCIGK